MVRCARRELSVATTVRPLFRPAGRLGAASRRAVVCRGCPPEGYPRGSAGHRKKSCKHACLFLSRLSVSVPRTAIGRVRGAVRPPATAPWRGGRGCGLSGGRARRGAGGPARRERGGGPAGRGPAPGTLDGGDTGRRLDGRPPDRPPGLDGRAGAARRHRPGGLPPPGGGDGGPPRRGGHLHRRRHRGRGRPAAARRDPGPLADRTHRAGRSAGRGADRAAAPGAAALVRDVDERGEHGDRATHGDLGARHRRRRRARRST